MGFGEGLYHLAMAGLGIAVITLLVKNSQQTAQVAASFGGDYNQTLSTLSGQGGGMGYGGRF
jgi:hypothetical protein